VPRVSAASSTYWFDSGAAGEMHKGSQYRCTASSGCEALPKPPLAWRPSCLRYGSTESDPNEALESNTPSIGPSMAQLRLCLRIEPRIRD
jgi:hypothetical protein